MAASTRGRRDGLGSVLGLLVFLGGLGLLLITFKLAYEMFSVAPEDALGLKAGQPIVLEAAGSTFAGLIVRVLVLIAMGILGSFIANRGITLYTESRGRANEGAVRPTEKVLEEVVDK